MNEKKAEQKPSKMVKIKTLRAIQIGETLHPENTVLEVTEAEAKEFTRPFDGPAERFGEFLEEEASVATIHRAIVVPSETAAA